jgi:hypothetical protein
MGGVQKNNFSYIIWMIKNKELENKYIFEQIANSYSKMKSN